MLSASGRFGQRELSLIIRELAVNTIFSEIFG